MDGPFELFVPHDLTFQDYLAISQCARTWCDGYDFKSYPRLISTLAPKVVVDYTAVNSTWGSKIYDKEEFARLWLSEEHLGLTKLRTQHLLGLPYFTYVGPSREGKTSTELGNASKEVKEIELSWQVLASHGRIADSDSAERKPSIAETSDHRAIIVQKYVRIEGLWKISLIKPQPLYIVGDFEQVRRPADAP